MRTHTALAAGTWLLLLHACGPKPSPTKETASISDTVPSATPGMSAYVSPEVPGAVPAEQLNKLAHQVTATSLAIHPGDVVIIDGGKHTIDLMEAIAVEAEKAGGM